MESENPAIREQLTEEQCRYAARALFAAATMSGLRAVILPWLVKHCPPNTFPGVDADTLLLMGFGQAVFFGLLAAWSFRDPLPPAITALVFFIGVSAPDVLNNTGFLAQGLISKFVMVTILGRALLAAIHHRLL
jgi:hypothetical protein